MNMPEQKFLSPQTLTATREAIMTYAEITGDFNPIHVDPEFARASPMGEIIAHGTLSLTLVWQSLESTFGAASLSRISVDVRFVKPVHVGDVVTAGGARQEGLDAAYDIWVRNQHGVNVIEGVAAFSMHQS